MAITLSVPPGPSDWIPQTSASDPGPYAELFDPIAPTPDSIGEVVRNLGAHYRAQAEQLPEHSRSDVNLRWVASMLAMDQRRHPGAPLAQRREIGDRLQGCCRDHTLLAVSILRYHGVPARSRVGFASYFVEGWHHDHVVAEMFEDGRWRRFDPELAGGTELLSDPTDLEVGAGAPFTTAAEAYQALRAGTLDPSTFGVAPGLPFAGADYVLSELFWELAHRCGDELLLWDGWGAIPPPGEAPDEDLLLLLDEVAARLVAADAGDLEAEREVHETYRRDPRLHPGACVVQFSPWGSDPVRVDLGTGPLPL